VIGFGMLVMEGGRSRALVGNRAVVTGLRGLIAAWPASAVCQERWLLRRAAFGVTENKLPTLVVVGADRGLGGRGIVISGHVARPPCSGRLGGAGRTAQGGSPCSSWWGDHLRRSDAASDLIMRLADHDHHRDRGWPIRGVHRLRRGPPSLAHVSRHPSGSTGGRHREPLVS